MTFNDTTATPSDSDTGTRVYSTTKLAEDCSVACNYEIREAAGLFLQRLRIEDIALYEKKQREAMFAWAVDQVRSATYAIRGQIAYGTLGPASRAPLQPLGVDTLRSMAFSWLDWPVRDGVPLRNATRATLDESSRNYLVHAKTYTARGRLLGEISKRLPDDQTRVADVLSESDIFKLAVRFKVTP